MNRIPRFAVALSIAIAAFLCVAMCHQGLIPTVSAAVAGAQDQAPPPPDQGSPYQGAPDQGPDPAGSQSSPKRTFVHN